MGITQHLAKHLREAFLGGNWTWSNLRDNLKDVTLAEATQPIEGFNSIATLTFHIQYYLDVQIAVLSGQGLHGSDKEAFTHPPFGKDQDWAEFLENIWRKVEQLAGLIETLPDAQLDAYFVEQKYGTWFRNLAGLIEHTHYHIGQIVILKKLIRQQAG